ncbi:MAG: peptide ABC transporter substrate-binding protein [Chloroflexi bacterium]|nr:peptide ABC transporter substrate-binding protein [Chloroflexota bacterium]MBV9893751.1 peptide ABC transporter substrate-binding protein [Chloroflexota bacterium]
MRTLPRYLVGGVLLLAACGPAAAPTAPTSAPAAAPTTAPAAKPTTAPAAAQPTTAPAAAQPTVAPTTPPAAAAGQPKRGGVLKVGLQADPTSLDPQKTSLTALFHVTEHIYSLLVRLKPDLTVEPDLAEKWDISPDGKTYTFTLRQGVKFHSGKPLTSADVKYTFDRLVDPATASPNAAVLSSVDTITTPDDNTVVITLNKADASFLTNLTGPSTVIINKAAVDANGDLTKTADGTGPFKFKEYVPNTRVVLERNPDYWETGKPYLDGIEMTIASDDTARTAAVRTGTVDFIEYAPLKDIPSLKSDSSLALAGDQNTNIRFIGLNVTRKPFTDLRVRQAIAAVVDRDAVLGPAVFGFGTPTLEIFPPGYWAGLGTKPSPPDVAKAKQLLSDAGYPDGFSTTILSWSQYSFLSNAAVVVQDQLKQIGITADVNLEENAAYIKDYLDNNFDLTVTGTSAYVDPNDIYLRNFGTGQPSNAVRYSNPAADDLIAKGVATTDETERKKIYQQLQQLLLDDVPWVNLYIANQFEAMKTYVKGYTHIPTGTNYTLKDAWLDK